MLEQIPFLQNCEDEDSDEDDELDSVQHKKQRVKVSAGAVPGHPPPRTSCFVSQHQSTLWMLPGPLLWSVCGLIMSLPRVPVSLPAMPLPQ